MGCTNRKKVRWFNGDLLTDYTRNLNIEAVITDIATLQESEGSEVDENGKFILNIQII
ncbi:MAG: hypothetical protein IPJ45_09600 [Ignavibacteria bacterium]|nr:hypothetical protein [Ignavibacteria bacterium]